MNTYMWYSMKTFEEEKITNYWNENEFKSILKKKNLEYALMSYLDREEKN